MARIATVDILWSDAEICLPAVGIIQNTWSIATLEIATRAGKLLRPQIAFSVLCQYYLFLIRSNSTNVTSYAYGYRSRYLTSSKFYLDKILYLKISLALLSVSCRISFTCISATLSLSASLDLQQLVIFGQLPLYPLVFWKRFLEAHGSLTQVG